MMKSKLTERVLAISLLAVTMVTGQLAWPAVAPASRPAANLSSTVMNGDNAPRSPEQLMDDSGQSLALGRQVYAELQQARLAALDRQAAALRSALLHARQSLARLSLPPALTALKAQTTIVANDLVDSGRRMDADLWIPIETELAAESGYLAPEMRVPARLAASAGRIAAQQGDRKTAGVQLNLLTSYLQHAMGAFPLQRVQADVRSAWSSASLPQPYWKGTLEAVQSALAEVRWVAGVNAKPLLRAYTDTVNAYVVWPQRKQAAIDYLGRAQAALRKLPDGSPLVTDIGRVIEKNNLGDGDIRHLVDILDLRIQAERAAWRDKLMGRFASTTKT